MKHDGGQMMLLAAVLLILGFVALAGIVGVAQRLGDETLQEQRSSLEREFERVFSYVDDAMLDIGSDQAEAEALLEQMARIEERRGLSMGWPVSGPSARTAYVVDDCAGSSTWSVAFFLGDSTTRLTAQIESTAC